MSNEQQFLSAIAKEPDNIDLRFVFADWLEEQGDPRSNLIRLEEQAKSLAFYSDEYWDLKPALRANRKSCQESGATSFLDALGYSQRLTPVFQDCPNDWRSRWRLIREFVERWFDLDLEDVGRVHRDVDFHQQQIGAELPPSAREWLSFVDEIQSTHARQLCRDGLSCGQLEGHQAFTLNLQAEGDVQWAVPINRMHEEDPPVDIYFLDHDSDQEGFARVEELRIDSVSVFAFTYITTYLRATNSFDFRLSAPEAFIESLRQEQLIVSEFDQQYVVEGVGWLGTISLKNHAFKSLYQSHFMDVYVHHTISGGRLPKLIRDARQGIFPDWK